MSITKTGELSDPDDTVVESSSVVVSQFSYCAQHEDELSFPAGAHITNVHKFDPAWWRGDYGGSLQAIFPANFVRELDDQISPPKGDSVKHVSSVSLEAASRLLSSTAESSIPVDDGEPRWFNRLQLFGCAICHQSFTLMSHLSSHVKRHKSVEVIDSKHRMLKRHGSEQQKHTKQKKKHTNRSRNRSSPSLEAASTPLVSADPIEVSTSTVIPVRVDMTPYRCSLCDQTFTLICELSEHLKEHSECNPYHCKQCVSKFPGNWELMAHVRTVHESLYCCSVCGNVFSRTNDLAKSGVKACEQCYKSDAEHHSHQNPKETTNTKRQKLVESEEYICKFCDMKFKQRITLEAHVDTKHKHEVCDIDDKCGNTGDARLNALTSRLIANLETSMP